MRIVDYDLRKLVVPLDRPIGDSQIDPVDTFGVAYLEVRTDTGERGIGFESVNNEGSAILPPDALFAAFEPVGNELLDRSPFALRNRMERPRGGNYGTGRFDRLIDIALWDLCAKHADMPLYEFMGGESPRVPAYASGLAFAHDDGTTRGIYERFASLGFSAVKVKVGYPTVEEDLARLRLVRDVMGEDCRFMIDANEAFSPKEAIRRVGAYREAGFDVYWFEDPTFRDDVAGIERVVEGLPGTHVNTGEYVGLEGKRELLERGAADVLNVHGLTTARAAATLAGAYGVPVSVGNTPCEIGVHAAASLPEVVTMEYSMLGWRELLRDPVAFEDGYAIAPDGPGHGLAFADEAFERYEQR